jgi:hypothetical protein
MKRFDSLWEIGNGNAEADYSIGRRIGRNVVILAACLGISFKYVHPPTHLDRVKLRTLFALAGRKYLPYF